MQEGIARWSSLTREFAVSVTRDWVEASSVSFQSKSACWPVRKQAGTDECDSNSVVHYGCANRVQREHSYDGSRSPQRV